MKIVKGVVKNLQLKVENRGVNNHYLALFELGDRKIRIKFPQKIEIKEGDSIAVAGDIKNSFLDVFVYKNLTTLKSGSNRGYLAFFLGFIQMVAGFIIIVFKAIFSGVLAKIFAFILIVPAIYLMFMGLRNYFVINKIKSM